MRKLDVKDVKGDDRKVDVFHEKFLLKNLQIQWQDHGSTKEMLITTGMKPLSQEVGT